jgi:ABC-type glutathione transport system ATPase component
VSAVTVTGLSLSVGSRTLVHTIDFAVEPGEALGIVGESGSGKSLTLRAILGLLPRGIARSAGSIEVAGRVGMVFQEPLSALDPLMTVGAQVAEVCRKVRGMSRAAARERVLELFTLVGLPDPADRARRYPHELSGGQRQRIVIAIALAAEPDVLLCDEPTTALDVTVQAQVLDLLDRLRRELGIALVFVSHDIAVVARMCSRVLVMHSGIIVERGETLDVIESPQDPYTKALLAAVLPIPEARA